GRGPEKGAGFAAREAGEAAAILRSGAFQKEKGRRRRRRPFYFRFDQRRTPRPQALFATLPPIQATRVGGIVTRPIRLRRTGWCELSGLALLVGDAKSPLQWMVMLFHGVSGAKVPPS